MKTASGAEDVNWGEYNKKLLAMGRSLKSTWGSLCKRTWNMAVETHRVVTALMAEFKVKRPQILKDLAAIVKRVHWKTLEDYFTVVQALIDMGLRKYTDGVGSGFTQTKVVVQSLLSTKDKKALLVKMRAVDKDENEKPYSVDHVRMIIGEKPIPASDAARAPMFSSCRAFAASLRICLNKAKRSDATSHTKTWSEFVQAEALIARLEKTTAGPLFS